MKFIISLISLFFFSSVAMAHSGHGMSENVGHDMYHLVLLVVGFAMFGLISKMMFVRLKSESEKRSVHRR